MAGDESVLLITYQFVVAGDIRGYLDLLIGLMHREPCQK